MLEHWSASTPVKSVNETTLHEFRLALRRRKDGSTTTPATHAGRITRCRALFAYAEKRRLGGGRDGMIDGLDAFVKPDVEPVHRAIDARTVRSLLSKAPPQLRAMIYLAINCGLGNNDCAKLQAEHIRGDILDFKRPKNGNLRKSALWPQTIRAIRAAGGLPFRTKEGNAYVTPTDNSQKSSPSSVNVMTSRERHSTDCDTHSARKPRPRSLLGSDGPPSPRHEQIVRKRHPRRPVASCRQSGQTVAHLFQIGNRGV